MNKTKISAEIVAHSTNQFGDELISVLCTFPRIILSEMNTHRMLSKNTSSSRAISFNKMVESVKNDPFIPIAWQKHHSGMQGNEYLVHPLEIKEAQQMWKRSLDYALASAKDVYKTGVTKQLCNRLLEPFMWTTMLITGSKEGWQNFFKLRCPQYLHEGSGDTYKSKKDFKNREWEDYTSFDQASDNDLSWFEINEGQAEIHMMALAECIWDAMNESNPTQLLPGMYHIPFRKQINELYPDVENDSEDVVKISVSMAARTSYTVVGDEKEISKEKHIDLHDRLIGQNPPHSSPLEHVAQVPNQYEYDMALKEEEKGWFYNLKGFKSYRYIIEHQK